MPRTLLILAALGCALGPASAEPPGRAPLAPSGPVPRQADDLDTVKLASAQRERARSVDERTTGLWQSWLVSICEGCSNLPPAEQHVQAVARRDAALRATQPRPDRQRAATDLSNEALNQIRSMPR